MSRAKLISAGVLIAILINFYYQAFYVLNNARNFPRLQSPPGHIFIGLRPYLKNIPWAGYYSDNKTANAYADVNSMFAYQQAQYSLSPTLLDYYKPFKHEFIIFNSKDLTSLQGKVMALHGHVLAVVGGNIILVQRDK